MKKPGQKTGEIISLLISCLWKTFFWPWEIDIVKKTSFSEIGPVKGKSKIYAVTSVDQDGLESELSEEVTVLGK